MRWRAMAAAVLVGALVAGCSGKAGAGSELVVQGQKLLPLVIHGAAGEHRFRVEVARTAAEQEQGLMYRTELPNDGGMLFPSETPEPRAFWMKNTVIPLDMIFIRRDGSIARIAEGTVPQSLDPVESGEPVIAVLEIAGGKAAALGIAEGDRVSWEGGPGR